MKLKSRLRATSLETLRATAEFWGLKPEDESCLASTESLADYLYPRLQTASNFQVAFERLEVREREIVYFLALHGGELPIEEARRRCGLRDRETTAAVIGRLTERGFVWKETIVDRPHRFTVFGLPDPYVRLIDLPPYWRGFLGRYLQGLSLHELKAIVREVLDEKYEGRRKRVLVHYARQKLLDPEVLRGRLERWDPDHAELFQQILQKNGACVWRDLLDGGAQKKFNHSRAESLQELTKKSGMVFVSRRAANYYESILMVPRDVRHIVRNGFRRDERTLSELSRGGERSRRASAQEEFHPNIILDTSRNLLRDLAIFLGYVRHQSIKVLNNGGVGRNDIKKVIGLLSHHKTIKHVSFLALFAISKKLMIPVGDQWRVSKNVEAWLSDSKRCFRELFEFWLTTNEWNEEFLDGDVVHVDSYPQNLISIIELRKLILRVLRKTPSETWIGFETFVESLLPQVAIQVSGTFGSRQEEAQRLGRILRPKSDGNLAHFYPPSRRRRLTREASPPAPEASRD